MLRRYKILLFLLFLIIIKGCMEDTTESPPLQEIVPAEDILIHLEATGDEINMGILPPFIIAAVVNEDPYRYDILDIRTPEDFQKGHIQGAVNISHTLLFEYLSGTDTKSTPVVIVSASGQAAAYYATLLRLYGFDNVFCLMWGMACWHSEFADVWLTARETVNPNNTFDNIVYDKPEPTKLPDIIVDAGNETPFSMLKQRVQMLLNEPFYIDERKIDLSDYRNTYPFMALYRDYDRINNDFENLYIICYGSQRLYHVAGNVALRELPSHPPTTVWYENILYPDTRAIEALQTIPSDKQIMVYSATGQESAALVAYLRILGYDARSILFGLNNFQYDLMVNRAEIGDFAFMTDYIHEYELEY